MENINKPYYILNNKALALAISYIIDEDYYTYDNKYEKGKKVYSFKNTDKFQKALTIMTNLRKDFI